MGRALTPILQRSILILSRAFNFHNFIQLMLVGGGDELDSCTARYADFTKKRPFELRIQLSLSGLGLDGSGTEKMAYVDWVSNSSLASNGFQSWSSESIR